MSVGPPYYQLSSSPPAVLRLRIGTVLHRCVLALPPSWCPVIFTVSQIAPVTSTSVSSLSLVIVDRPLGLAFSVGPSAHHFGQDCSISTTFFLSRPAASIAVDMLLVYYFVLLICLIPLSRFAITYLTVPLSVASVCLAQSGLCKFEHQRNGADRTTPHCVCSL